MLEVFDAFNEGREDVKVLESGSCFRVLEWNQNSKVVRQLSCALVSEDVQLRCPLLWCGGAVTFTDYATKGTKTYRGTGLVATEYTDGHIWLEEPSKWKGGIALPSHRLLGHSKIALKSFGEGAEELDSLLSSIGFRNTPEGSYIAFGSPVPRDIAVTIVVDSDNTLACKPTQLVCWSANLSIVPIEGSNGEWLHVSGNGKVVLAVAP